jgi:hypothetical protein
VTTSRSIEPRLAIVAIALVLGIAGCRATASPLAPLEELPVVTGTTYYLSPDGSDAASGGIDDPWATMFHAAEQLEPGDALVARGGTYAGQGGAGWPSSGTADAPILFAAYPGETPIFDGDGAGSFLILEGISFLHILGLTITDYSPEETGVLVIIGDSQGVTLEGLTMAGHHREQQDGIWTEHLIYPGQGPVRDLTIRDSLLDGEGLNGGAIHVYHDPGPIDLLVENNVIINAHWGVLVDADAHGVTIRGNEMRGNDLDVTVLDERATDVAVDPADQLSD